MTQAERRPRRDKAAMGLADRRRMYEDTTIGLGITVAPVFAPGNAFMPASAGDDTATLVDAPGQGDDDERPRTGCEGDGSGDH